MRTVEFEWSSTQRGTVRMEVPDEATDDEVSEQFWNQGYDAFPDRSDFDFQIYEVS